MKFLPLFHEQSNLPPLCMVFSTIATGALFMSIQHCTLALPSPTINLPIPIPQTLFSFPAKLPSLL
jgi:hypothetical protein